MANGVVIHLDNDSKGILEPSKNLFDQLNLDLDYITCETKESFNQVVTDNKSKIKALIFDLLGEKPSKKELHKKDAQFLEEVQTSFANINIPIFIYSGYLQALDSEFENCGTVFKADKDKGIQPVFDKFKMLFESGFIGVFCPGGILETEIYYDLNKAFTKQFIKSSEIEKIINNIKGENGNFLESSERIKKIFKRIAVRSLLSVLLTPEIDGEGKVNEATVNSVEHYIRRIGDIPVWTGDIFKKNDVDEFLFVLTPRCNVIRSESILVCPFGWKDIIKQKDKISKLLQGDPHVSGYDRYLPPSPIFEGGKLSLSKYSMVSKQTIINDYKLHISLSDELTNEIIGKFGAHFFRTGITPWDPTEAKENING